MGTAVRVIVSLLLAAAFEWLFFEGVKAILKPPRREVKQVIQISLIKPKVRSERITVERQRPKREVKEEKKRVSPVKEKPKIKSSKPLKELPRPKKQERREEKKQQPVSRPTQGLKPMQGNLPAAYVEAVREAIAREIFYPLEAYQRGIEGPVMVQFTLDRSGKVLQCKPLFGEPILTEATCIAIKKARFPKIPESVKNDTLTFRLSLEYNLKRAFSQ
ncbi:energy transducer TonB [Thermovibrio ammonificans]|jgi:protein TonB|uniref:energy transducer TonB n=1 Tax=Thermovibrio ammonificans TaxID=228745 RepID=UPI00030EB5F9|nr:TonB family protein [Thermovibrio ammonificans]